MADITNATAVKFSNDKIREAANKIAQAYYFAVAVKDEWYANNMGALFPEGGNNVIDGSLTDGRHVITRDAVVLLINRCEDLINDLEANTNAKLNTLLTVATHPTRD